MKPFHLAGLVSVTLTLAAGNAAAQQVGAAPAPAPAVAPAPVGAGGSVRVHLRTINNKGTARLYIHRSDGSYTLVCASPCTADVPANSELRTTMNNNDEEPHTFVVPGDLGPEVDIQVRPASVGPLIGGIILMGSGGAFVLSGLLFVALADVTDGARTSYNSASTAAYNERQADELKTVGFVMIGIGVAAAVVGLVWLTTRSHEPRVEGSPHRPVEVYGRAQTFLGDVALAKPRDATTVTAPPLTPLRLGFTF